MIVSCPNCSTKYNLPDDKVPASGLKVKCSKCTHLFKVQPPAATPEEEVEVLLDDSADAQPEQDQSSDFDAAFEEAVAGGDDFAADDAADDDLDDSGFGADDDLDDLDLGDDTSGDDDTGFDENIDDDDDDDFGLDDDDDDDDFGLSDDDEGESTSSGSDLNLGGESGLFDSLDDDGGEKKKSGIGKLLLTVLLFLLLIVVAAIATFNLKLWSVPASMPSIELPFDLPVKVPFFKGPGAANEPMDATTDEMGGEDEMAEETAMDSDMAASMGDPKEQVKEIQPVDFRQYVINNEVEQRIFVVEGKALNNSDSAKEMIEVEVSLFAEDGTVVASKKIMCGNTLSLFQLQVDDRATIDENLSSSRGINLNNSYIKPGESTPFMVVFFDLPDGVEEYRIEIAGAQDPQR